MNHLLLNGYLETTDGSYSVVKLTERSEGVLCGAETVTMKMAKEPERRPGKVQEAKKKKPVLASGLRDGDEPMFEKLRSLRASIAREEKVPPVHCLFLTRQWSTCVSSGHRIRRKC